MKPTLTILFFLNYLFLLAQPMKLLDATKFETHRTITFQQGQQNMIGLSFDENIQIDGQEITAAGGIDIVLLSKEAGKPFEIFGSIQGSGNEELLAGHYYDNNFYQLLEFDDTLDVSMTTIPLMVYPEQNSSNRAICKYDMNGQALWAGHLLNNETNSNKIQGTAQGVLVSGIALDSMVYISPSGIRLANLFAGEYAGYLIHLDQDGEVIWYKNYPLIGFGFTRALTAIDGKIYFAIDAIFESNLYQMSLNGDSLFQADLIDVSIQDIQIDSDRSIYLVGNYFHNNSPDWDFSGAEYLAPGVDSYEMMLAKYNEDFEFQWLVPIMGQNIDTGTSLCIGDDDVYLTGCIQRDADFDPTAGDFILNASGFEDAFIAKYKKDGAFITAYSFGGTSGDVGFDIQYQDGHLMVFGIFSETMNVDLQNGEVLLVDENDDDTFSYFYLSYLDCANADCTTGQNEINETPLFSITPNPAQDWLQISSNQKIEKLSIINALGQTVIKSNSTPSLISLRSLAPGQYFIQVELNGQKQLRQFIKLD